MMDWNDKEQVREYHRARLKKKREDPEWVKRSQERRRETYAKNREKNRERKRRYYADNSEKERERMRKWREENPEKEKVYQQKYREDNREKARLKARKWREENKRKVQERKPDPPILDVEKFPRLLLWVAHRDHIEMNWEVSPDQCEIEKFYPEKVGQKIKTVVSAFREKYPDEEMRHHG